MQLKIIFVSLYPSFCFSHVPIINNVVRTRSKNLVVPTSDDLSSYATETEVTHETSGITELKELNSKPAPYFATGDNDADSDVEELDDLADPKGSESGSIKLSIVSYKVWKFHDFSITQILCEIKFGDSRSAKSAILANSEALNYDLFFILAFF